MKPHFRIIRSEARQLSRFGRWIYATNVLDYTTTELDDIVVGRRLGASDLGLYRMAFTISQSAVTEIAQTINQVMFPAFSLIQDSKERMIKALTTSTHFAAFVAFPLTTVFVVAAEPLTETLLGDKWLGMVTALQVLAVAGAVRTFAALATIMFEGAGEPHLSTRDSIVKFVVLAAMIVPMVDRYGINGAAWSSLLAVSSVLVPVTMKVRTYSHSGFSEYLGSIFWPLGNAVVMAGAMYLVQLSASTRIPLVQLILMFIAGIATYAGSIWLTSRYLGYRQPREILERLRSRRARSDDDGA